ncbi:MAG: hypothetical protein QOJ40_2501 [Verrucomicrobiota bacterium]
MINLCLIGQPTQTRQNLRVFCYVLPFLYLPQYWLQPNLQVRNKMRLGHYSIHTERSYVDWIKRYISFHHMRSRGDPANGESKIEAFCTDLAVNGKVAPSMWRRH